MSRKSVHFYDLSVLILSELSDAGSKYPGAHQRGNTAYHMYRTGPGKVMEAHLCKKTASPDPVCFYRIDQSGNDPGINTIGYKFRSLSHSARNNGRRCCAEYQIKHKIGPVKAFISRKNIKPRLTDQAKHILAQ